MIPATFQVYQRCSTVDKTYFFGRICLVFQYSDRTLYKMIAYFTRTSHLTSKLSSKTAHLTEILYLGLITDVILTLIYNFFLKGFQCG
jgi:hypothetical protein